MENTIKKDNRKALPKFLLIMVCAGIIGGIGGYFSVMAADSGVGENLGPWLCDMVRPLCLWLLPVLILALIVFSVVMERKAAALRKTWDGEDEEVSEKIDGLLGILMMVQNITMPLGFLAFSVAFVVMEPGFRMMILAAEMLVFLAVGMYFQKRTVDFTRTMNPEKQGSVFDMNFCKKWQGSCDEAEKKLMGEAAMTVFLTMNKIYAVVWAVEIFLHIIFHVGMMPMAVTLGLWLVSQLIYQWKVMKLSGHAGSGE